MTVTVISEKYIFWEGNKYRKLKPKTTKKYKYKLTPVQKTGRAKYMVRYRLLKRNERLLRASEPTISTEELSTESILASDCQDSETIAECPSL